jgi:hypothetical protein
MKKDIIIILITGICMAGLSIGFFFLEDKTTGTTPSPSPTPSPHSSPTPSPSPHSSPTPSPSPHSSPTPSPGPTPGPTKLNVSSEKLKNVVQSSSPFNAVEIYKNSQIPSSGVLLNYVSVEYDPTQFPDDANSSSAPVLDGILQWFSTTLNKCQSGDFILICGDFISMDEQIQNNLQQKCTNGVNVILVVDRWEISGYPLLSSQTGQSWSPSSSGNGCIGNSRDPCKVVEDGKYANKYPYGCPNGSPGQNNKYCPDTNAIILKLKGCNNFYILDEAATILNTAQGTSRNSPFHNHRHMTTFYLPSQQIGSTFKGSWNFTGGSPHVSTLTTGQKESGFVVTADLNSDIIQSDIIWNYYWLTTMSVFCPASLAPPAKFTSPGGNASPIFNKLLGLINQDKIDISNDQLLFPPYGGTVELYSITQQGSKTYISADLGAKLSIGFGPPPGPLRQNNNTYPNPTPWESQSSMLDRKISDGSAETQFKTIWPALSCVSNTQQFLYPYTPVYKSNPVPPLAWRVPSASAMPQNCGGAAVEYFDNSKIGQSCSSSTDCGDDGNCVSGYCAYPGDKLCSPGGSPGECQRCGRITSSTSKDDFCNPYSASRPHCYSAQSPSCQKAAGTNDYICTTDCPCYKCVEVKTCSPLENNDVGSVCFNKDSNNQNIPSNKCYKDNGVNYDCAARVPWAPGGLWLGGLMYKFWKDAGEDTNNRSIYVSMYSSFDDTLEACILQCPTGKTGGSSAWGDNGMYNSIQYKNNGAIDSQRWYSYGDPNCIQNIIDFLNKNGKIHLLRGQWKNLNPGVDGDNTYFKKFKDISSDGYNARLYLAQKKQVTKNGGNGTVTTTLDSDGNPDKSYISKDSILSCSGHPYNGGSQDWGGINEVLLVEKCSNACKPVRSNWELIYNHGEKLTNAATFPWAKDWANSTDNGDISPSSLTSQSWNSGSTTGGLISV